MDMAAPRPPSAQHTTRPEPARAPRRRPGDGTGSFAQNPRMRERSASYRRIYAVVERIPRGRVATYGHVARLAGMAGHARQVGYALHALRPDEPVPWHRVINARGEV